MPEVSGEFVWRMEDVLELYAEPYDPARPVVGFDEASKELHGEVAVLPGATHHSLPLTAPDDLNDRLLDFLGRRERTSRS